MKNLRPSDPAEGSALMRLFYRDWRPTPACEPVDPPSNIASSGRRHFPLPVGAPLSDFEAIVERYPVYRIDNLPARAA